MTRKRTGKNPAHYSFLSMENNKFSLCYSGFCFLEYDSHKSASLAKRRLETGRIKVWSCDIIVDWADPQEEPDQETMNQVNISIPDQQQLAFFTRSLDPPSSSFQP